MRYGIATSDVIRDQILDTDEVNRLSAVFLSLPPASIVLVPLALGGHLDHRLVRQAAMETWLAGELIFYENLPYACRLSPAKQAEQIHLALPWECERAHTVPGSAGDKLGMALCYRSQIAEDVAREMEDYSTAMGWTERLYGTGPTLKALSALSRGESLL